MCVSLKVIVGVICLKLSAVFVRDLLHSYQDSQIACSILLQLQLTLVLVAGLSSAHPALSSDFELEPVEIWALRLKHNCTDSLSTKIFIQNLH